MSRNIFLLLVLFSIQPLGIMFLMYQGSDFLEVRSSFIEVYTYETSCGYTFSPDLAAQLEVQNISLYSHQYEEMVAEDAVYYFPQQSQGSFYEIVSF